MVNNARHFCVVWSGPPGVVQTVSDAPDFSRSFLAYLEVTRLPEPPLSSRALSVTGFGLPLFLVLNLTNTIGFKSVVF